MAVKIHNIKRVKQILLAIACLFTLMILSFVAYKIDNRQHGITSFRVYCENSEMKISWQLPLFNNTTGIKLSIDGNNVHEELMLPKSDREYVFCSGEHGRKYTVTVVNVNSDGSYGDLWSRDILLFDEEKLPDIPIVRIETAGFTEPLGDPLYPEGEGKWGTTLQNNDYIKGQINYSVNSDLSINKGILIRTRGNTSSAEEPKKSYKIKFNEPVDMLNSENSHAHKEWVLLNSGGNLNNCIGEFFSTKCGASWVAHMKMVNVIINGDWKGIYYLSEPVNKDSSGGKVGAKGYLFENDAYWWVPGTSYFRLENQREELAFTLKYPRVLSDKNNQSMKELEEYLQTVVGMIEDGDENCSKYIDVDSFVTWIMVRDLMHTGDGGGSNMYYYLYDLNSSDYMLNKLKMGPLWDFDACMRWAEMWHEESDTWSTQHNSKYTYFGYLFEMPFFSNAYKNKWQMISNELQVELEEYLDELYENDGEAIQESRLLDAERWGTSVYYLNEEIEYDKNFIRNRISFIDSKVKEW